MVPWVSARAMGRVLWVKEWFGESGRVRVRRSNASSFTCVLCSEVRGVFLLVVVVLLHFGVFEIALFLFEEDS
jgi:hypothetical protein